MSALSCRLSAPSCFFIARRRSPSRTWICFFKNSTCSHSRFRRLFKAGGSALPFHNRIASSRASERSIRDSNRTPCVASNPRIRFVVCVFFFLRLRSSRCNCRRSSSSGEGARTTLRSETPTGLPASPATPGSDSSSASFSSSDCAALDATAAGLPPRAKELAPHSDLRLQPDSLRRQQPPDPIRRLRLFLPQTAQLSMQLPPVFLLGRRSSHHTPI